MTVSAPSVAVPQTSNLPAARWQVDASHSSVGFSVRHLMISNVKGEFQRFSGELRYDPKRPEATKLSAQVEVASINTREEKRDAHLRSADFFDAEKFPSITFESRQAARKGDELELSGELTIHGVTREVVLTVGDVTAEQTDPWGNVRIGASAKTKIKRSEFGMTWNAALELGGVMVGDDISIAIDVSLVRAK